MASHQTSLDEKKDSSSVYKLDAEAAHVENAGASALVRPTRVFSAEEEKALYRKIDFRLMPILAVLYLLSFMDRGNIGNARLYGLEAELHMAGFDYNIALTAYFCTYCFFEVPANLMLKKLRPSIWLLLYLTFWYPRHYVQLRIAVFFSAATMAGAFSGLLAYGIGYMGGVGGYAAWRWIFILEGLATIVAGIVAFWAISDLPADAKFLTEDERAWVVWRKQSDNSSVGEAENITPRFIWKAFSDWQVWISVLYYSSISVPIFSIGLFLPSIIKSFGTFTTPQVQLLTVPVYVAACIWVVTSAYLSDKYKKRYLFVIIDQAVALTGFIINICDVPPLVKYFGLFLCTIGSYAGLPSVVTWLGNNLSGQTKRGVGMATQIGIGNLGGIVASNIYRSVDAPRYFPGHGTVIGFFGMGMIASTSYMLLLKRANARKLAEQAHQDSLPEDQKRVYTVAELRDLGDRAPEFMYTI